MITPISCLQSRGLRFHHLADTTTNRRSSTASPPTFLPFFSFLLPLSLSLSLSCNLVEEAEVLVAFRVLLWPACGHRRHLLRPCSLPFSLPLTLSFSLSLPSFSLFLLSCSSLCFYVGLRWSSPIQIRTDSYHRWPARISVLAPCTLVESLTFNDQNFNCRDPWVPNVHNIWTWKCLSAANLWLVNLKYCNISSYFNFK